VKIIFIFLCAFVFVFNASAQIEQPLPEEVSVETISLARDNGNGKPGEETDGFYTRDIPIYCVVQLNSIKPASVKMNLVAVKVAGVKAETKVITVVFKTNGKQSRVYFTGKPDTIWTAGMYRIDIFVDNKANGSKEFEIQKSPQDIGTEKKEKQMPPKSTQKPKTAKRIRKN
jgi:hypothetical protein